MFFDLKKFIFTDPKLPDTDKDFIDTGTLPISIDNSRDEIISIIHKNADKSEQALIALYTYRQMDKINWLPFIKAAMERNPVCFTDLNGKTYSEVYTALDTFPDESIYDGKRLAFPDEVWNFRRGDGIEKALLLADFIRFKDDASNICIKVDKRKVSLQSVKVISSLLPRKILKRQSVLGELSIVLIECLAVMQSCSLALSAVALAKVGGRLAKYNFPYHFGTGFLIQFFSEFLSEHQKLISHN